MPYKNKNPLQLKQRSELLFFSGIEGTFYRTGISLSILFARETETGDNSYSGNHQGNHLLAVGSNQV